MNFKNYFTEGDKFDWASTLARKAHNAMFSKNEEGNIRRRPEFGNVDITKIRYPIIELGMSLSQVPYDEIDISEYAENDDMEGAIEEIHNRIRTLAQDPEFIKRHREHEDSLQGLSDRNWD